MKKATLIIGALLMVTTFQGCLTAVSLALSSSRVDTLRNEKDNLDLVILRLFPYRFLQDFSGVYISAVKSSTGFQVSLSGEAITRTKIEWDSMRITVDGREFNRSIILAAEPVELVEKTSTATFTSYAHTFSFALPGDGAPYTDSFADNLELAKALVQSKVVTIGIFTKTGTSVYDVVYKLSPNELKLLKEWQTKTTAKMGSVL